MARSKVTAELGGRAEVQRALDQWAAGASEEVRDVVRVSAKEMEGEAVRRTDWEDDSGETRRSIKTIIRKRGLSATVGTGYFKARFFEFGTVKMPARPFLNPAAEIVRPKYLERLAKALMKAGRMASTR